MYKFIPTMYISVGAKTCFFTLRETYNHCIVIRGVPHYETRSFHHFNLSQDPDEALAKAMKFASESGLQLTTTREKLVTEMNDIKRANAEELERREREAVERQAEYEAQRKTFDAQMREVIAAGFFPFGKYEGLAFEKADRGYLQWVIAKREDFEVGSYMRDIADKLALDYTEYAAPEFNPTAVIGEEGQRLELTVRIVRSFRYINDFGVSYITTMVTGDNVCLVSMGVFYAEVGDVLKIKGTVKRHDEYKGQAQTRLQRIKIIETVGQS